MILTFVTEESFVLGKFVFLKANSFVVTPFLLMYLLELFAVFLDVLEKLRDHFIGLGFGS